MTASDGNPLRHPWWVIGLLLVVCVVCVALGFWQLDRAEQSRALESRFEAARELPVIARPMESAEISGLRYRELELEGRYVPERQFLIDNIVHRGAVGYYVLTPFEPDDSGPWLIVNRGWVRAGPDRAVQPDIAVASTDRRVAGRLDALPSPGLRLDGERRDPGDDPVVLLSYPTMQELEQYLKHSLFDYQLLLDPDEPDGYERSWTGPPLRSERNLAYAGQWWLFGAVAGVAAIVLAWRHIYRRSA